MIIALVQLKGGVGKSTLAVCIASELQARGRKVLLIDTDSQATAVTWNDVATEKSIEGPTVVAMSAVSMHKNQQLPALRQSYDDVVIDTPPRLGDQSRAVLMMADVALLPCGATGPDAWALAGTLDVVEVARSVRDVRVAVVLNRLRHGTLLAAKAREVLSKGGLPVLRTELGLRQAYADALGEGTGVLGMAPHTAAAGEMSSLVDEVIEFAKGGPDVDSVAHAQ